MISPKPALLPNRTASPETKPALGGSWIHPLVCAELFAVANLAFLGVDILLAHSMNAFHNPAEWYPIYFSAVASLLLLISQILTRLRPDPGSWPQGNLAARRRWQWGRALGLFVGASAVVLGVVGLIYHLQNQFFELRTIKSLVYAAPFVAPLAYTGVGLLIVLNRMVACDQPEWGWWVVTLAMFGFAGNFVLSLTDHAQNGFFHATEWISVVAAAYATASLVAVMIQPESRPVLRFTAWILGGAGVVGMLGAGLHLLGNFEPAELFAFSQDLLSGKVSQLLTSQELRDRLIYGAPAFAPLLFTNLSVLGGLGLWGIVRTRAGSSVR